MVMVLQDVQVPVCPLCNTPIPVRRGEPPDIKMSEHIDSDCQSDPAQEKRRVFANKCSLKGCKQKEVSVVSCTCTSSIKTTKYLNNNNKN